MLNFILASLALVGPATDSTLAESPPLKIWINNNRGFKPGEAVKVQVETGKTGYLLVVHFSPSGQLSVLFPLAPGDDALVQAERRYEVRDPDGSVSFVASGSGPGLIYSALSDDPWQLESVNLSGAWDYGALTIARDTKDPEADITALVQRLSSPRGFDYDVLDYAVFGDRGGDASPPPSWWSPTYADGYSDGCYCGYGPSAIYVGFGFNWGYGGWPWYWGFYPYAAPYSYYGYSGYGYPYYPYGGYGHYPGHGHGYYPYNRVVGRPRGYQVNPVGTRPHGDGRGTRGGSVVTSGEGVFSDANAPARRARGGSDRTSARGNGGGVGRPASNGGGRTNGDASAGNSGSTRSNGGDRARSREGSDRSRPSGRSGYSTGMTAPNVEQARPSSRARGEWVRVEDATGTAPARRAESPSRVSSRVSSNVPTRVDMPEARRTYRPEAPRSREVFQSRPSNGGEARASGGGEGRAYGGGEGRPSERARSEARGSGGKDRGSTPSYAAPRSNGGGNHAAPRSSGGGGGGGRGASGGGGSRGGGGGGRSRP